MIVSKIFVGASRRSLICYAVSFMNFFKMTCRYFEN